MTADVRVIAVDGPAASGKSTLARRVADHYDLRFLDTGLIYRAVARRLLDAGEDPVDRALALAQAGRIQPEDFTSDRLRGEGIGNVASLVASYPDVRRALLPVQRRFAREHGAVLAGRDIGTVVCPDADAKVFVTASLAKRAERRFDELRRRGDAPIYEHVLAELAARDERDAGRAIAPMTVADGAAEIDTTDMALDAAFAAIRAAIDRRLG